MINENKLNLEITQEKLIDLLLHAATREDIAKLDLKNDKLGQKLETKIDHIEQKLETKIDNLEQKIDTKINNLEHKIDSKINNLESKLEAKIDKVDTKCDRLLWGVTASILAPIILHFIH